MQRLAEPYLIGQHQARAVRAAMSVEGELYEVLLMFPKPDFFPVDRCFDHYRRRIGLLAPAAYIAYRLAT